MEIQDSIMISINDNITHIKNEMSNINFKLDALRKRVEQLEKLDYGTT